MAKGWSNFIRLLDSKTYCESNRNHKSSVEFWKLCIYLIDNSEFSNFSCGATFEPGWFESDQFASKKMSMCDSAFLMFLILGKNLCFEETFTKITRISLFLPSNNFSNLKCLYLISCFIFTLDFIVQKSATVQWVSRW